MKTKENNNKWRTMCNRQIKLMRAIKHKNQSLSYTLLANIFEKLTWRKNDNTKKKKK